MIPPRSKTSPDERDYASDLLSRLLDTICDGWEGLEETEEAPLAYTVCGSFPPIPDCYSVFVDDCSQQHGLGRIIEIVESEAI